MKDCHDYEPCLSSNPHIQLFFDFPEVLFSCIFILPPWEEAPWCYLLNVHSLRRFSTEVAVVAWILVHLILLLFVVHQAEINIIKHLIQGNYYTTRMQVKLKTLRSQSMSIRHLELMPIKFMTPCLLFTYANLNTFPRTWTFSQEHGKLTEGN